MLFAEIMKPLCNLNDDVALQMQCGIQDPKENSETKSSGSDADSVVTGVTIFLVHTIVSFGIFQSCRNSINLHRLAFGLVVAFN